MSEKMDIMHLWNEVGALHSPNDIRRQAYVGACERGLALIIGMNEYLMVTRITIKKTEVGVLRQPL